MLTASIHKVAMIRMETVRARHKPSKFVQLSQLQRREILEGLPLKVVVDNVSHMTDLRLKLHKLQPA